ncbi:hypothetical protein ACHAPX_000470 [Trichoderma viride]
MNKVRQKSKNSVITSLDKAAVDLQSIITTCSEITIALPDAFTVVAKNLPLLLKTIENIKKNLEEARIQEAQQLKERFAAVYQLSSRFQDRSEYLQALFEAISSSKTTPNIDKYREVVIEENGLRIEVVLKHLLQQTLDVATAPLVDEDLVNELKAAFDEVASLQPSLAEESKGVVLNNHGLGNQFYHGGRGNQNHCSGGIQVTGDGATNHIGGGYN